MGRVAEDGGLAAGPLGRLLWLGVGLMASMNGCSFSQGQPQRNRTLGPFGEM